MAIDTSVEADPSQIDSSVASLNAAKDSLDDYVDNLSDVRRSTSDALEGETHDASVNKISTAIDSLLECANSLGRFTKALTTFSGTIRGIRNDFAQARSTASGNGLIVTGDVINEPTPPVGDPSPAEIAEYNRKVTAYNAAGETAYQLRQSEQEAHETMDSACEDQLSLLEEFIKSRFPPGLGLALAPWAFSRAKNLGKAAQWLPMDSRFRFAPRGAGGKFVSPKSMGTFERLSSMTKAKNWVAKSGQAGSTAAKISKGASKILSHPATKWVGRGMNVLSAGLKGYEQYQADAHNPQMGEGERIARAGTRAAVSGVSSWAGATAGAKIGGMIGAAFGGPLGILAGSLIGGAIGGFAASKFGDAVGDSALSLVSKLFH